MQAKVRGLAVLLPLNAAALLHARPIHRRDRHMRHLDTACEWRLQARPVFRVSRITLSMRKNKRATRGRRNRRDHESEEDAAAADHDDSEDIITVVLRHYTGFIVVTYADDHVERILTIILDMGARAKRAALLGDDSLKEDLIIGLDVEFGKSHPGRTDRTAVVQFATAKFVVIIPLEALTEYKRCKPAERRGMNVRHQLRHARCIR